MSQSDRTQLENIDSSIYTILAVTALLLYAPAYSSNMQSGSDMDTSGTSSGPPTCSPIASVLPGSPAYSISVDDAEILLEHLEEFENARKCDCAKIIKRAMVRFVSSTSMSDHSIRGMQKRYGKFHLYSPHTMY